MGEFPSREHQFKKGQVANPNGRPKTLTSLVKEILQEPDDSEPKKTKAEALIRMACEKAKKGNFQFFRELFDRSDGRAVMRVALGQGNPLDDVPEGVLDEVIKNGHGNGDHKGSGKKGESAETGA